MKLTFLLPLILLTSAIACAQNFKELPGFGKVTKEELQLTECSFDKNSGAMVIFNEAESFFKIDENAMMNPIFEQTEHHVRIKIFNKNGFGQGSIKLRYPSGNTDMSIKHISAQTYNLDAAGNIVITKVDKGSIYDKKINARFSEKIFAFPEVKEGSVLEFTYIMDGSSQSKWYFQKSIPVLFSRFIVRLPKELTYSVIPYNNLPMQKGKFMKADGEYSWYAMENIPGLKDEPFMSCPEDYLQNLEVKLIAIDFPGRLHVNLVRTWPGVIKTLIESEDFGKQLKRNIPRTSDLDAMLAKANDDYTKMAIIHKYVRTNMEWNKLDNIWAVEGVRSAWKDKKGTSGEINLILINLLKDADLKVYPVLVSSKDNGVVNTTFAGLSQFNKVLAYVEIGDKVYVLDATEKETPSYLIPLDVMASEGLLIKKPDNYEWGWKVLWDGGHRQKNDVFINAEIDEHGMIKGSASVKSFDYEKIKHVELLKKGIDKLKESMSAEADVKIDSFAVTDADDDKLPLLQSFNFERPAAASGDYHYFSANLFAGLNTNLFLADERKTDIFFGVKQEYLITGVFFLPKGYEMETLPKNIKMITSDTGIVFKRHASYSEGMLTVNISLEFKNPVYSTENYPELQEFYKKLFGLLNEKFTYRKKS